MSEPPQHLNEQELTQRELLLTEAERIVHLGSWMWDTATNGIRWSDELFRIYGLEPRSVLPTVELFFDGIHPADLPLVREVTERGLATANPEPVDFRIVRSDGSERHVHMEAALVRREDSMLLVGSLLDITERLELESRLRHSQKMEAIGTLAGGVAHDFNNYLQVIFGHVDLLLAHGSVDARAVRSLHYVRESAQRCQRLTQQLLSFGRRQPLLRELVDLEALVGRTLPMLESLVGDGIRIRTSSSRDAVLVECDAASIEQVLLNLVANARDAMPNGGVLRIATDECLVSEDGERLHRGRYGRISIHDEGVGIAPDVLPRIFEPFYTTKGVGHGTGLGLATSWGIVQQTGGSILVDSELGNGSTFRVMLPVVEAPVGAIKECNEAARRGRRVLVVEDQAQVRMLAASLLEAAGYDVLEAEDGKEALRLLDEHPDVDLVLSDVAMPEMSGIELVHALAKRVVPIPVVLMSGFVDADVSALGVPLLRKPFDSKELLRAVSERLRPRVSIAG